MIFLIPQVKEYTDGTIEAIKTMKLRSQDAMRLLSQYDADLRVLLDKPPDIVTPTVGVSFLFGYIINSTYPGGLPKVKSLDLGACTVLWGLDQVI